MDRGSRARRIGALCAVGLLALAGPAVAAGRLDLVFDRFNGSYRDLRPELAPVDAGGVELRLESPRNLVRLFAHRVSLSPGPDGGHVIAGTAEIGAVAELEAEIAIGGVVNELRDEITVPRQELALSAVVLLERIELGYLVTVVEVPQSLEIAIESRLGASLVELCRLFPWVAGGCEALDRALSSVRLPLPRPGDRFLVDPAELLPSERHLIDSYLGVAGPAGSGQQG